MENPTEHRHPGQEGHSGHEGAPQNLPNGNTILILGLLSIFLCWWHIVSVAGIVLGITALVMAKREKARYFSNPSHYTISSLNNVSTGRICAIIGLTISCIVFFFVLLLILGVLATLPFWGMIR